MVIVVDLLSNSTNGHRDDRPAVMPDKIETAAESLSAVEPTSNPVGGADWSFARRPFWLFSHLFALAVIVLFVNLGLWQLSRHNDRQSATELITDRTEEAPLVISGRGDLDADAAELAFRRATVTASFVDADFVRVVNRSQGGVAGEYVVAIVEFDDGSKLAVNRGFVPVNADVELTTVPTGSTQISGWLQESVLKGRFGVDDSGQGSRIPRFNTDDVAERLGEQVPSVWLQLDGDDGGLATFPDPVPLPPVDSGPHLSYAAQWFIFATLGLLFYGALLWRQARTGGQGLPSESAESH